MGRTGVFILLLGGLFWFLSNGDGGGDRQVLMTVKDYLVASFKSELPEIKKSLPHRIDNSTTLLNIDYSDGKVYSFYRLDGDYNSSGFSKEMSTIFETQLKKSICADKVKRKLLDVDVEFIEKYVDSNNVVLLEFTVSNSLCSSTE